MTRTPTPLRIALLLTLANGFIDPYTILERGGAFANVQTGNVIFFALDLSERRWGDSLLHVWSLVAFISGVAIGAHIKSGRVERIVAHPLRWAMAIQATVLAVIGFLPASIPHSYAVVPISLMAGMQADLFRRIGDVSFFPLATTGNLVRFVMAGYDGFVERQGHSRRAFAIYSGLITTFASGAVIGAFVTRAVGVHAIWVPAALLAITLGLFVLDQRGHKEHPA